MKHEHILLSLVGMTPQVVTETLYALHVQGTPWPTRILVITTKTGAATANRLLDEGHLRNLCEQIKQPLPRFGMDDIKIVLGADGQEVDDARTPDDHEALANFIMTIVRNLARDDNLTIHASLAGGRKTMTFYLGYAMSLFGRSGDSLSHVLVKAEFENQKDFFYPGQHIQTRKTAEGTCLNLDNATVELADIPFIRHRGNLPSVLLEAGESVDFRTLVNLINLGTRSEHIKLTLDVGKRMLRIADAQSDLEIIIESIGLLEFAFYLMMARATINDEKDINRPTNKADMGLSKSYLDEVLHIYGLPSMETTKSAVDALMKLDSKELLDRSLASLRNGMTQSWFDHRIIPLREEFERYLPVSICEHILPKIRWDKDGNRVPDSTAKQGGAYGIGLTKENILLIEPENA
jgi:CRISPR-associated protein (TIGR02584 family)